eukprot:TRINITY_DN4731_c0_g2_i1.p1 TRINITY_DN4731_c0_g2~~TRINITY_DN4731_c0_g2_i1.p1  ORF type:complete len:761 (+),score=244.34 TRINITY_DN4731_c0_g2_i1:34-2316(+)
MPGDDDDEMVQALVDLSSEKEEDKGKKAASPAPKFGEKKSSSISWLKDLNEGYLHMSKEFKSKKPKKYEKWWFVLEDSTLSYFAKKDLKKQIGSIEIGNVKHVKSSEEFTKKKKFVFTIATNDQEFYLYTDSLKGRQRWVEAIQEKVDEKKKVEAKATAAKSSSPAASHSPTVAFAPTLVSTPAASATPTPAAVSSTSPSAAAAPATAPAQPQSVAKEAAPVDEAPKPKPVLFKALALFDCEAEESTDLGFVEGDILDILDDSDPGWWEASMNGISGVIPSNYVHQLKEGDNPAEILAQRAAEMGEEGGDDLDQLDQLADEALAVEEPKDEQPAPVEVDEAPKETTKFEEPVAPVETAPPTPVVVETPTPAPVEVKEEAAKEEAPVEPPKVVEISKQPTPEPSPVVTPSVSNEIAKEITTPEVQPVPSPEPQLKTPVETPEPTPESVPEPTPESVPEPTHEPVPEPQEPPKVESSPSPAEVSHPETQSQQSEPQSESQPEAQPQPVAQQPVATVPSPDRALPELAKATTSTSPERSSSLTSLRTKEHAVALNHYESKNAGGLSFRKGDIITIIGKSEDSKTLRGELNGKQGTFPASLVQAASALVSSKPAPTSTIERAAVAKEDMSGVAQRTASLRDQWKKVVSQGALEVQATPAPKPKPAPVPSVSGARTLFKGLEASSVKGTAIPRRNFGAKAVPSKPERASRMFTESDVKALQASGITMYQHPPTSTPQVAAQTSPPQVTAQTSPLNGTTTSETDHS